MMNPSCLINFKDTDMQSFLRILLVEKKNATDIENPKNLKYTNF